ncbi:MAG: hypothetical protein ACUVWW_03005 [Anaerolineae bacterium]
MAAAGGPEAWCLQQSQDPAVWVQRLELATTIARAAVETRQRLQAGQRRAQAGEMSVEGWLFRVAYNLNRHRWGDLPLAVAWTGFLLLSAAVVGWGGLGLPRGVALGLVALAVGVAALSLLGRLTGYVRFRQTPLPPPAKPPVPLVPTDKVAHRASGWFEVEGKRRYLVEVPAWFRTFETREHAVMAYVAPSRFFPGHWPEHEVGMWYIFFLPQQIQRVEAGEVLFGARPRLGLRVEYRDKDRTETVLLSFDSEDDRQRIYADLVRDAHGG